MYTCLPWHWPVSTTEIVLNTSCHVVHNITGQWYACCELHVFTLVSAKAVSVPKNQPCGRAASLFENHRTGLAINPDLDGYCPPAQTRKAEKMMAYNIRTSYVPYWESLL